MQKSCPQPLDFYHRRVSCHRYRGHPRRAARHRGAYRGRRDDRRPRRRRRGRATIAAVVPDRSGRRAPSAEHAFEAGFVYNTQYYRGPQLPEPRDDLLSAIGSISVLTLPGDNGWWSVTLYHSPRDKQMRKVRDPKAFGRVLQALPNHAHWATATRRATSSRWPPPPTPHGSSSSTGSLAPQGSCRSATHGASPTRRSGGASHWG